MHYNSNRREVSYLTIIQCTHKEGIVHLVPPLPPNPFTRVRIRGKVFGEFGGLRLLGGVFPPLPSLLAHLGCTPAIGAQWVPPLTGMKKIILSCIGSIYIIFV